MELKEIKNKQYFDKGRCSKSYLLEDGNVLKIFNNPKDLSEIDRFKYFLNFSNDNFIFPFEFIYDDKKFYGYITKFIKGDKLENIFPKSSFLNLSNNSYKLERNIDFISDGGIWLLDFHAENVLYDGKQYSVIDHDENALANYLSDVKLRNQQSHRTLINNLFIENLVKFNIKRVILEKINKYRMMKIYPSEMIVTIKEDLDKYFKEDINSIEDIKNIMK